jgi:hypothetical protein
MTSADAYFHSDRLSLRLPPELLARIDAHVAHFQDAGPPGFRVTRAAVIRGLLMHALDQAEAVRAERGEP